MTDAVLSPTPNDCPLPRRRADFSTFNEAIDYAARSEKGLNFHDMRGDLERVYTFAQMREDALDFAHKLVAAGVQKNDRIALVAETSAEFAALFCGCVYAGAWPVPLPLPTTFGGKESYIDQLSVQLESSDPKMLLYPPKSPKWPRLLPIGRDATGKAGMSLPSARGRNARYPKRSLTISAICNTPADRPVSPPALR